MKILVAAKCVIDAYVKIRVKSDNTGVETQNVKMSMNPFDEIAVEQAVQFKENNIASDIIVASIGPQHSQDILRAALALGADRAIHIQTEQDYESLNIAKILKAIVEREKVDLVIMGKQSIDGDNNQTGQMLAALLAWSQGTFVSDMTIENGTATVVREVDGGLETLKINLPAVITTDLRLNEPRYATLPNIMKAKQKPLEKLTVEELGLTLQSHIKVLEVRPPCERQAGVILENAAELVSKLKHEEKVI